MTPDESPPQEASGASEKKGFISRGCAYFWDKIFDKLLVILVTGIVIFLYQEHLKHEQKNRDEAVATARIYTEIIIKQRVILMEAIGGYMQLLEELEDRGIATPENIKTFRDLRKKVLGVIRTLYPLDQNIKKYAVPLIKATEKPSINLMQERDKDYIRGMSGDILQNYLVFMEELRKITINKAKEEIDKAEQELKKKGN